MNTRPNTHLALLEGGVWLPGVLPGDAAQLSRAEMVQVYVRQGEGLRRGLEKDGLLRHLVVENGFPLNLRPPGLLPALPFLPLLGCSLRRQLYWSTTCSRPVQHWLQRHGLSRKQDGARSGP